MVYKICLPQQMEDVSYDTTDFPVPICQQARSFHGCTLRGYKASYARRGVPLLHYLLPTCSLVTLTDHKKCGAVLLQAQIVADARSSCSGKPELIMMVTRCTHAGTMQRALAFSVIVHSPLANLSNVNDCSVLLYKDDIRQSLR